MQRLDVTAEHRPETQLPRSLAPALPVLATLGLMGLGGEAYGQVETLGFRIGEKSKLHTNLDLSTGYDTNSLRQDDDFDDNASDVRLMVRPSLSLDVPGRAVAFRFGLGATISQFLGVNSEIEGADETLFGFDANLYFRLGSNDSAVSFILENQPTLTPTVIPEPGAIGADERLFPAFADSGRAFLRLRPGGGALEFDVGYRNDFVIFTRSQPDQRAGSPDDGYNHVAFLESRLKFLPKTAALFYAEFGWFDAANPEREVTTADANPFSVLVGLIGQITRTVSLEVRAGYAETLVWAGDRFGETDPANQRSPVGLISMTWKPIGTAQLGLTYQRSLQTIVALSSFIADAFRFRADWSVGRLVLGAYAEVQLRDFGTQIDIRDPGVMPEGVEAEPFATLVLGGARAEYYFLDWLTGGLSYGVMAQNSNDEDRQDAVPALGGFTRHQFFANVGVRY